MLPNNYLLPRNTCLWKLGGTTTFRLSSTELLGQFGTNLQNPSKKICKIYEPDKGKIFLQCDQSGAEALIVAYECKPGKYRELFLQNIKPHVFIGLAFAKHWEREHPAIHEIAKLSIAEIKNHPAWEKLKDAITNSDNNPPATRYYYHYKQTCHSSNYGIKAPTFQLNLLQKSKGEVALTRYEAEQYLEGYHTLFPEIRQWNDKIRQELKRTRILRNLFGYPREFTSAWGDDFEKEAISFIPQSTVGTITNLAFVDMQNFIEKETETCNGWDLMNNKHDSMLIQVPDNKATIELAAKKLHEFMERDLISSNGEKFKMKSEVQCGYNWAPRVEYKNKVTGEVTVKNPKGLQTI